MIVQFSINTMDSTHMRGDIKRALEQLDERGLEHQVGPIGTCIQGDWQTTFEAIRACHQQIKAGHERVVTTIIIDDHGPGERSMQQVVRSVEEPSLASDRPLLGVDHLTDWMHGPNVRPPVEQQRLEVVDAT